MICKKIIALEFTHSKPPQKDTGEETYNLITRMKVKRKSN